MKTYKKKLGKIFSGDNCGILGINRRNLDYIYPGNSRKFFRLVDRKLETKEILEKSGIPFPETLKIFSEFRQLLDIEESLKGCENYVIKPNSGRGGEGILVIGKRRTGGFTGVDNKIISYGQIKKRISEIIMGVYSYGISDIAFFEERIFPHNFFMDIFKEGLADIRIVVFRKRPVMSMMRIPTLKSQGRANLHQGGIGVSVHIKTGVTGKAQFMKENILTHPDSGAKITGFKVPFFSEMLKMCRMLPDEIKLDYLGFDFAVDRDRGPLILEVNARPGLEIQNINGKGLLNALMND